MTKIIFYSFLFLILVLAIYKYYKIKKNNKKDIYPLWWILLSFGLNNYNIKSRYIFAPQMEEYDNFHCSFRPYLMFFNKEKYKSKIINTDKYGFRFGYLKKEILKIENFFKSKKKVNIVIGGSFVFGIGSTKDSNTIPSVLSKINNIPFLNFGGTAMNSKQELYLFLNFIEKFNSINKVIIISGINDLYLNCSTNQSDWGNFFFENKYKDILIKKKFFDFFKKLNSNSEKRSIKLNFNSIKNNYLEILSIWKKISLIYNFDLHFYLQPFCGWFKNNLSDNEKKIFDILDNSNDFSHRLLKKLSSRKNYYSFNKILKSISLKNKIKYYDLNEMLRPYNDKKKSLFVDRVHMGDNGYQIISNKISDTI